MRLFHQVNTPTEHNSTHYYTIPGMQVFVTLTIILVVLNVTVRGLQLNIDAPNNGSISTIESPESCVCFATDSVEVEVTIPANRTLCRCSSRCFVKQQILTFHTYEPRV